MKVERMKEGRMRNERIKEVRLKNGRMKEGCQSRIMQLSGQGHKVLLLRS
jgi:hypothetical protein